MIRSMKNPFSYNKMLRDGPPVHHHLYNTRVVYKMVLLSNRSIPARGRTQQPISCKDLGFLRIMDALYALSDTYLHFPQDYMSERRKDLCNRKKRRNGKSGSEAAGYKKRAKKQIGKIKLLNLEPCRL